MVDLQRPIPSYLTQKSNITNLIVFTAVFALVFINFYAPFGVELKYNVSGLELLFYSSLVILTGVLVVVVSRIIMYYRCKRKQVSHFQYIFWSLTEVFFMALFYTFYEKVFIKDARAVEDLLKISIQNTALVLLIPYSVSWLYLSWKDKKLLLADLANGNQPVEAARNMIPFYDEKGALRLSVKVENLLYIEASDNYVTICYLNKDKVSRFLLRNTLKRMEEVFRDSSVIRCHRSYMVNFDKVKVIRKDKDGLLLELDVPVSLNLLVSKTYVEKVLSAFSKFC